MKNTSPAQPDSYPPVDLADIGLLNQSYNKRNTFNEAKMPGDEVSQKIARVAEKALLAKADRIVLSFTKNNRSVSEVENLLGRSSPDSRFLLARKLNSTGHYGKHQFSEQKN